MSTCRSQRRFVGGFRLRDLQVRCLLPDGALRTADAEAAWVLARAQHAVVGHHRLDAERPAGVGVHGLDEQAPAERCEAIAERVEGPELRLPPFREQTLTGRLVDDAGQAVAAQLRVRADGVVADDPVPGVQPLAGQQQVLGKTEELIHAEPF
jgi:hypothetical protein